MTNYKLSQMPIPAAVPTIPAVCARQSYYALPPGHGEDKEGLAGLGGREGTSPAWQTPCAGCFSPASH